MARYWPSFLLRFMDRDEVRVGKNAKKKERGQYPAILTEQGWSTRGLLYGQKAAPRLWEQSGQSRAGNPERAR